MLDLNQRSPFGLLFVRQALSPTELIVPKLAGGLEPPYAMVQAWCLAI